jgi:hypothetical protein
MLVNYTTPVGASLACKPGEPRLSEYVLQQSRGSLHKTKKSIRFFSHLFQGKLMVGIAGRMTGYEILWLEKK